MREPPMTPMMFDLAAADPAVRFSPYCWRIRLACALKGIVLDTTPWRFTEAERLPQGHRTVPTLLHEGGALSESFDIALWLERTYPDAPPLLGDELAIAHLRLIAAWSESQVSANLVRNVALDIWSALDPADQPYFRASREKRFGASLEAVQDGREGRVETIRAALQPARMVLRRQPYLGGESPSFADILLFAPFMWVRAISLFDPLEQSDALWGWRERMLDAAGGQARNAPRAVG
jgi:glutathione S-transferase